MRQPALLVWCFALLTLAPPAECTQSTRLKPGARIRFDASSLGDRMTGSLVRWETDTLIVRVDGDAPGLALVIPTDSVTRLDVQHERAMTLEGLGLGVLAGSVLALVADPDALDEDGNCTTAQCLAYQVSPILGTRVRVLAGLGALLGIIVGSETKTQTWSAIPLDRLTIDGTSDGGLALGVRIWF